jgi:hypothetical protein
MMMTVAAHRYQAAELLGQDAINSASAKHACQQPSLHGLGHNGVASSWLSSRKRRFYELRDVGRWVSLAVLYDDEVYDAVQYVTVGRARYRVMLRA